MSKLFCMPLGETMHEDFAQMATNLNKDRKNKAIMLLPSSYLLNKVRQDFHVMLLTFDELAKDIVRRGKEKHTFINRLTQELLVEEVLKDLSIKNNIPYFNSISTFPGYVSTVTSLIGEIKRTGTLPDEFAAVCEALDNPRKDKETYLIYQAYQDKLKELELLDLEEVYFAAVRLLEKDIVKLPYTDIFISDFYIFTPLQLEIINRLMSAARINISIIYEKNRDNVYAAIENTYTSLIGMGFIETQGKAKVRRASDLQFISEKILSGNSKTDDEPLNISIAKFARKKREVEYTASRIKEILLEGRSSADEIAVVVRSLDNYQDLPRIFAEYGVPVNMSTEVPVAGEPLARLLINCMVSKISGGTKASIINILKSPLVASCYQLDADYLEQKMQAYIVTSWFDFIKYSKEAAKKDSLIEKMCPKLEQVYMLIETLPERGTCIEFYQAVHNFMDKLQIEKHLGELYKEGKLALPLLRRTLKANKEIEKSLDEICNGLRLLRRQDVIITINEFSEYFSHVLGGVTVEISERKTGGIQIVSPASVRGITFSVVFILGLTEGEFPRREKENWLYNDSERALLYDLGMDILNTSKLCKQEDIYFSIASAMVREKLYISYCEDDKSLISQYVDNIKNLFIKPINFIEYDMNQMFEDYVDHIYSPKELYNRVIIDAYNPDRTLSQKDQVLTQYVLEHCSENFKRYLMVDRERKQAGKSIFSGFIIDNVLKKQYYHQLGGEHKYSISSLEDYAKCPFAFFIKRILKLNEWMEKDEDTDFDVFGSLYHAVLANFLGKHKEKQLLPSHFDSYVQELDTLLTFFTAQFIEKNKIVPGKLWEYSERHIKKVLIKWLHHEIQEQNTTNPYFKPTHLEWGFGLPLAKDMDSTSTVLPLVLNVNGENISIIGKVDRIDTMGDRYVLYDYKRKNSPDFNSIMKGLNLQIPIYIKAIKQFLCPDGELVGGGYYLIENPGKTQGVWRSELLEETGYKIPGRNNKLKAEDWDNITNIVDGYISKYIAGIHNGIFPVQPAMPCPSYCIGRSICRYNKFVNGSSEVAGNE